MRRVLTYLAMLKRLHWATWVAVSVTLLALFLIVVPGEYQIEGSILPLTDWEKECYQLRLDASAKRQKAAEQELKPPSFYLSTHVAAYTHGWPRPFLVRALVYDYRRSPSKPWLGKKSSFTSWGGSLYHNVSWSNYDNWPLSADGWLLRPWSLLLDLLVALGIVAGVGGLVQWRIERNGGLLRFHLADMLAVMTIIGIGLGTYLYHDNLRRRESFDGRPMAVPAFTSTDGWTTYAQNYQGPIWLRKLVGNQYYLPLFHHVDTVSITVDDRWRENFARLRRYPYLRTIHPRFGLPVAAIPILEECPQLEEIYLGMYELDTPRLIPGTQDKALQPEDFSQLEALHLTKVTVSGTFIQKQHIAQLAALPTMRQIKIQSTSATEEQIEELRQEFPQVDFHEIPDLQVFSSPG
ncbi:hypothetical protein Pan97_53400 [Bremerella volcania]|uniref:Uncharacterized protein n=1 Tax=Bremerella volcania TaxID=2527984 RepID=A0A518CGA2_9BACT|nr:hypothetical protein [Bremerella volcania]QDU78256.1 hypothetical protein Pan97_53400 [Bremerella volcania]